jgi:peptidoglycan hydrolase-like protein with peptidoglycan-binding domain
VKQLQSLLNGKGYGLVVDGLYSAKGATNPTSSNTGRAVADFQSKNGLVVDGLAGPATWQKL